MITNHNCLPNYSLTIITIILYLSKMGKQSMRIIITFPFVWSTIKTIITIAVWRIMLRAMTSSWSVAILLAKFLISAFVADKWEVNLFCRLHEFSWWLNAKCIPSHLIETSNQAANVLQLVVARLDGDWEKHKLSTKVDSASCSQHFATFSAEARFKRKHKSKRWKLVHTELVKVDGMGLIRLIQNFTFVPEIHVWAKSSNSVYAVQNKYICESINLSNVGNPQKLNTLYQDTPLPAHFLTSDESSVTICLLRGCAGCKVSKE